MSTALILQHVPFEGAGVFGEVLREHGYEVHSRLVPEQGLPGDDYDFLLVMGGPMSVNDPDPWIPEETDFIRRAIVDLHRPVLGVCLGSQFMARALGGTVAPGPGVEIGLTTLALTAAGREDPCFSVFPDTFEAIEWHGEGITAPPNVTVLASSPLYPVQAFRHGPRTYGLVFHLEMDEARLGVVCRECPQDLAAAGTTASRVLEAVRGRLEPVEYLARSFLAAMLRL